MGPVRNDTLILSPGVDPHVKGQLWWLGTGTGPNQLAVSQG